VTIDQGEVEFCILLAKYNEIAKLKKTTEEI